MFTNKSISLSSSLRFRYVVANNTQQSRRRSNNNIIRQRLLVFNNQQQQQQQKQFSSVVAQEQDSLDTDGSSLDGISGSNDNKSKRNSSSSNINSDSSSYISSSNNNNNTNNNDFMNTEIYDLVQEYCEKKPTPISLQTLMKTGRGSSDILLTNSSHNYSSNNITWQRTIGERIIIEKIVLQMGQYMRHELPIRIAHRINDLYNIPLLSDMSAVQDVKKIYINSFTKLIQFPQHIHTIQQEEQFATLLSKLYQNHAGVLVQMAKGAYQLREQIRKEHNNNDSEYDAFERMQSCHDFLDRFYMSRIGIRFLAGQYLSLRHNINQKQQSSLQDPQHDNEHYIGMINQRTSPAACIRQAASDASMMCRRYYGRAPLVELTGRLDLTFPYIPTYLHYILLELLKNALRATMETHMKSGLKLPTVNVIVADGTDNEDVVIKIADEGGGIPRSQVDKIWSYLFTTADPKVQKSFIGNDNDDDNNNNNNTSNWRKTQQKKDHCPQESPLAGLGYGLPISRSYCKYFGGDLDLISMEGYGTDAFVHLKRIGDGKEPVPV